MTCTAFMLPIFYSKRIEVAYAEWVVTQLHEQGFNPKTVRISNICTSSEVQTADLHSKDCYMRKDHNWDNWISYDEHVLISPEHPWRYFRECQTLGCRVQQRAVDLVSVGDVWTGISNNPLDRPKL